VLVVRNVFTSAHNVLDGTRFTLPVRATPRGFVLIHGKRILALVGKGMEGLVMVNLVS
jgi:hypothetical protein